MHSLKINRSNHARRKHVKFEDNSLPPANDNPANDSMKYTYEELCSPDLQKVYIEKAKYTYETVARDAGVGFATAPRGWAEREEKKASREPAKIAANEVNIDVEASDFIKRKHEYFNLQKLMSSKPLA